MTEELRKDVDFGRTSKITFTATDLQATSAAIDSAKASLIGGGMDPGRITVSSRRNPPNWEHWITITDVDTRTDYNGRGAEEDPILTAAEVGRASGQSVLDQKALAAAVESGEPVGRYAETALSVADAGINGDMDDIGAPGGARTGSGPVVGG